MDMGLDPNSVLYYLMEQWCNMMDDFGIYKKSSEEDGEESDEEELPW